MDTDPRLTAIEEQVAHLTRVVDELSEIVARQETALEIAGRRLGMLMEVEAARQADGEGAVALGDQRPPHW
ncbi:SlyX family protein [Celeribacter arenosi]|uniref:SlyX family protein n=1 Tax=Celeribacter arenosi TaxID=792649 RepID=A0ABP7K4T0_9RHOB